MIDHDKMLLGCSCPWVFHPPWGHRTAGQGHTAKAQEPANAANCKPQQCVQCSPQPGHQPELDEAQGACEVEQGGEDQRHETVDSSQTDLDLQRGK